MSSVVTSDSFEPIGWVITSARIQTTRTNHLVRRPVTTDASPLMDLLSELLPARVFLGRCTPH